MKKPTEKFEVWQHKKKGAYYITVNSFMQSSFNQAFTSAVVTYNKKQVTILHDRGYKIKL
jgi:hypothetical protein